MKLTLSSFLLIAFALSTLCVTDALKPDIENVEEHNAHKMEMVGHYHNTDVPSAAPVSRRDLQQAGAVHQSCLDFDGFSDDFDDGCAWYLDNNACSQADSWVVSGPSANVACCTCGGGLRDEVAIEESLTLGGPGECRNIPGFFDSDYDGCEFYESNPETFCAQYGNRLDFLPGLTANVACCACGGGISS